MSKLLAALLIFAVAFGLGYYVTHREYRPRRRCTGTANQTVTPNRGHRARHQDKNPRRASRFPTARVAVKSMPPPPASHLDGRRPP